MELLAVGLNHNTAPLNVRERLAFAGEDLGSALKDLRATKGVGEAAILSTCNRTDLYFRLDTDADGARSRRHGAFPAQWLGDYHGIRPQDFEQHCYRLESASAVRHVMRVASGLDSMIVGEPQILGQLKSAYRMAVDNGTVGAVLGKLFQQAFSVAKRVRSDTAIGSSPVSVAFAGVRLAQQIFGDLSKHTALLIGAGETIELTARHLRANGLKRCIVANRTLERAHRLAVEFGGYAIELGEIHRHIAEADIVIASTGSASTQVTVDIARQAIRARRRRPMLMVDLAVPRDIEPQVGDIEDVFLYTVDDLNEVIEDSFRCRREAACEAEKIIDAKVDQFMGWLGTRDVSDTVRAVRESAELARDQVHEKAKRLLARGDDPQQVLHYLAHTLTNKLMHAPTRGIRDAGAHARADVIDAARKLYDLPEPEPQQRRAGWNASMPDLA
jgi:glutamyl-tRNA reductase